MVARADERQAPFVLAEGVVVAALQVKDVAEAAVRADDLQPGIARDVLILQLDGPPRHFLGARVLPFPGQQQRELEI